MKLRKIETLLIVPGLTLIWGAMSWGAITQIDADFARIVPEDAEVKQLATGFNFTEGPAVDLEGTLFFTDVPRGEIDELAPDGTVTNFRTDLAARANGLMFDAQGRLFACEGGHSKVTRTAPDGSITVLVEQFGGKSFNSPNDLVLAPDGGVYFTDPFFGPKSSQPQPVQGVYYVAPDGAVSLVVGDLNRPNGIMLSQDGFTLYVANDGSGGIWAYDVQADGGVVNGSQFAQMEGIVDGMTLDAEGNLYAAGGRRSQSQGVWIFSPAGEKLGVIPVPEMPTNCTFDDNTLYITAGTSVYSVELNISGASSTSTSVERRSWGQIKRWN